jgi:hypothetical protein
VLDGTTLISAFTIDPTRRYPAQRTITATTTEEADVVSPMS